MEVNRTDQKTMPRPKVIAVDMDQTLCVEECWDVEAVLAATPNLKVIEWVNKVYQENFIVVYTARRDKLIPATLEWLRRNNVLHHAISNKKMSADLYLDDKMIRPDEV